MARLGITAGAKADLQQIYLQIAEHNPEAARLVINRVRAMARKLAGNPHMGRTRDDLRPALFSFPVRPYVLFYRRQPGGIVLVRVIHGRRDLPRLF